MFFGLCEENQRTQKKKPTHVKKMWTKLETNSSGSPKFIMGPGTKCYTLHQCAAPNEKLNYSFDLKQEILMIFTYWQ